MTGDPLRDITESIVAGLRGASTARDGALVSCRQATRKAANAIRCVHRGDSNSADELLAEARELLDSAEQDLAPFPSVRWAGFVHDAQKEYAEARIYQAVVGAGAVPTPDELGVDGVAWLHGVAETVGELRRACLDHLRRGHVDQAEGFFATMEQMYEVLGLVDFPDSMTSGLRRAADAARAITERTRSDLSLTAVQSRLEAALERHSAQFR